jgi:hypothetical protein
VFGGHDEFLHDMRAGPWSRNSSSLPLAKIITLL